MQGKAPRVSYEINGNEYDKPYYLADGIYPDWATLVKSVRNPNSEKTRRFAKMQEACRKDVERGFGVLQARWAIVRHPARTWSLKTMHEVMTCYVIMHNMIVENKRPDGRNENYWDFQAHTPLFSPPPSSLAVVVLNLRENHHPHANTMAHKERAGGCSGGILRSTQLSYDEADVLYWHRIPVPVCCGQNPPASSDGQHSRAGNNLGLRLALVPPSDGPQSLWYTRPMLMQGVPPDLYLVEAMSSSSSVSSGLSLQSFSSSEPEWNSDHVPEGDLPLTDGEDDLKFLIEGKLISESEDDLHPWVKPTSSDGKGEEVEEEEEKEEGGLSPAKLLPAKHSAWADSEDDDDDEEEEEEDESSSSIGYPPTKRFRSWADSEDDDDDEEDEAPAEGWGSSDEELPGSSADDIDDGDDEDSDD
ncbi:hypothetical protein QYE76_063642 [Lolium multiflorum]|uniref:Uncharacterized protein n=1 Tax=Lolium multiflorum TaxID=4521 RepID=A0AAD8S7T4_LOLMU|nr:hypothetical protein QYE76_063642 [Lolium multiflorum]